MGLAGGVADIGWVLLLVCRVVCTAHCVSLPQKGVAQVDPRGLRFDEQCWTFACQAACGRGWFKSPGQATRP